MPPPPSVKAPARLCYTGFMGFTRAGRANSAGRVAFLMLLKCPGSASLHSLQCRGCSCFLRPSPEEPKLVLPAYFDLSPMTEHWIWQTGAEPLPVPSIRKVSWLLFNPSLVNGAHLFDQRPALISVRVEQEPSDRKGCIRRSSCCALKGFFTLMTKIYSHRWSVVIPNQAGESSCNPLLAK